MDLFSLIFDFFNFINSVIGTIINAISNIPSILFGIVELFTFVFYLLPNPLYPTLLAFISVYVTIFIYKLIRKG